MACATCHTHPPYSPDLASNDFYLFPPVKEKLDRIQVANEDQLFESLKEILKRVDQEKLNGIFRAWTGSTNKPRQ
jgi:hypothetical protein